MITMKGKFNTANIMIDEIDDTTREQIQGFLNHPAFANTYIAIMADCHAGKGAVIGFTMKMNDYIIPNVIGVDIGCGMLMGRYDLQDINLAKLDDFIKQNIPNGFHINEDIYLPLDDSFLAGDVSRVCEDIGIDAKKALRAIGSLGGGNHFIEAGFDSANNLAITVHSGSRNFGKCVADFYQNKAKEDLEKYFIRDQYRSLEFLHIDSNNAKAYLDALMIAQRFASANRKAILHHISIYLGIEPVEIIESVHNFIGEDKVVRKGATPANLGQKVVIPFNMADGIALCEGKGCSKYNNSAPHGAGRILSRSQAKKTLSVDSFVDQMKNAGVYTTTANESTLDEAPSAYKPMDIILSNIKDTVDLIEVIKPVYNFKSSGE